MQREQIEHAAEGMMHMALDNLERDGFGYVAFAALLVSKNGIMPLLLERVDAEQKRYPAHRQRPRPSAKESGRTGIGLGTVRYGG